MHHSLQRGSRSIPEGPPAFRKADKQIDRRKQKDRRGQVTRYRETPREMHTEAQREMTAAKPY